MGGPAWAKSNRDRASEGPIDKLGVLMAPGVGQMEAPRPQERVGEKRPSRISPPAPAPLEGPQPALAGELAFLQAGCLTRRAENFQPLTHVF